MNNSAGSLRFETLGNEDPEVGLFFFEARPLPVMGVGEKATGIGFLVNEDGLLVTCSHVLLALGKLPGMVVRLYGAAPELPISVDAEVLEDGWRGPDWRHWASSDWEGKNILRLVDQKPDIFLEDIAFLRLSPTSAKWDPARISGSRLDPISALLGTARVLPLGAPGYPHGSHVPLKSWSVLWEAKAPLLVTGEAAFLGTEPRLHSVIRIRANDISHGFSGAPLWDPVRCRVVGLVRRGIKRAIPDAVLGVDARFIATQGSINLELDAQANQLLAVLRNVAAGFAPLRHSAFVGSLMRGKALTLSVRLAGKKDLLDDDKDAEEALPAIPELVKLLSAHPVIVLSGGAGSGKSTLLWQVAEDLLHQKLCIAGKRLVPLMVRAVDFEKLGFDIGALLNKAAASDSWDADGQSLIESLELNDLTPVVLLDGLDEIDKPARVRVLSRLAGASGAARLARIIVASRPIDDLKLVAPGESVQGWPVLELEHLKSDDITKFATDWFNDENIRQEFLDMLNAVSWDKRGPTPLQLTAAARLFNVPGWRLRRPIDLTFEFISHLAMEGKLASDGELSRGTLERSPDDIFYVSSLTKILRRLGRLTIEGIVNWKDLVVALRQSESDIFKRDPVGLLRFLQRETTLLGGLVYFKTLSNGDNQLDWAHRTIAEALAAEEIAEQHKFEPLSAVGALQVSLRTQGQSFALTLLAAMDRNESCRAAINLALVKLLETGASDYNATLLAVRTLGAGIKTSDDLRERLVRTLIALLLIPEGVRLGVAKCIDLFTTDDLPNPIDIARRPAIRQEIIRQLHNRWSPRNLREKRGEGVIYVSEREATLLDRLVMWSDIKLPIARRSNIAPKIGQNDLVRSANFGSPPAVSAALMAYALRRLQDDADGFLAGFAQFIQNQGSSLSPRIAAQAYISGLLSEIEHSRHGVRGNEES